MPLIPMLLVFVCHNVAYIANFKAVTLNPLRVKSGGAMFYLPTLKL